MLRLTKKEASLGRVINELHREAELPYFLGQGRTADEAQKIINSDMERLAEREGLTVEKLRGIYTRWCWR